MAKKDKKTEQPGETPDTAVQPKGMPLVIHTQYVKDFSFENPNPLESLKAGQSQPQTEIDINLDAQQHENDAVDNFFEVVMHLKITSKRGNSVLFIAELTYGAAISLKDIPEEHRHQMVLIQTPQYMFPYARQILADAIQNGGYPPLLLSPVNFHDMYLQRFGKKDGEDSKPDSDK